MAWADNEILLTYSRYSSCGDIYQAVCDEIGKHYVQLGWKYARSRPAITYKDKHIKVVIGFSSSGSNTPGDSVLLQILPVFYSIQMIIKGQHASGLLLGHTDLFYHKYMDDDSRQIKVISVFGEEYNRIGREGEESKLIESGVCNVYGLDEEKFKKIIGFIDAKIIVWIDKIKTEKGILELTENSSETRKHSLRARNTNGEFVEYVKRFFPLIDIDERLKEC